jgi:hemerythrin-like domain-containing protein
VSRVLDTLKREHAQISRLLGALEHQVDVFERGGDPDYDVIEGIADCLLDYSDRCHHPKEDAVYGRLRAADPAAAAAVGDLLLEHRSLRELTREFRNTLSVLLGASDISRAHVVQACRQFIDSERRHMRLEDERFLPSADAALAEADWRTIEAALNAGREPLVGGPAEAAFFALSERLLAWDAETPPAS